MAKKKVGTLAKVTQTVKKAAKAVAAKAEEYVVEPVGDALGIKKSRTSRRTTRGKARGTTTRATTKRSATAKSRKTKASSK
jgi:hypothetical protein